ncbi:MAG: glycosyltransferase [Planctomycetota bacterium]|nr:glycosyltransferase [Planctomycetota bacterium]
MSDRIRSPHIDLQEITAVIMAKEPIPGQVKTRLIASGLSSEVASEVAKAMLKCILVRIRDLFGETILAISPDGRGDAITSALGLPEIPVINQGSGTLGDRLERVWQHIGNNRPIVFFGIDSPDIPHASLRAIGDALDRSDVAIGPTPDGGYWALASRCHQAGILGMIDWGSDIVYDQTCQRIRESGLSRTDLPIWDDVDEVTDLEALRSRLQGIIQGNQISELGEAPLIELAGRLNELLEPT